MYGRRQMLELKAHIAVPDQPSSPIAKEVKQSISYFAVCSGTFTGGPNGKRMGTLKSMALWNPILTWTLR